MSESPRARRVTIADVAREAGVSRTTVSHALSGQGKVNAVTRAQVREVADRLNYRPSVRARSLRSGRSQTLALLSSMPAAVSAGPSQLGFFTELAMGCARTALLKGYVFVLAPPDEETDPIDLIDIDGAILLEPTVDDPIAEALRVRGIPYVTIDGPGTEPDSGAGKLGEDAEGRRAGSDDPGSATVRPRGPAGVLAGSRWSVDLHHRATAELMLGHLIECGARQPGLIVSRSLRGAQTAARAVYAEAAATRGFTPLIAEAAETGGEEAAYAATKTLLTAHPDIDALLAPVDTFASGAVRAAKGAGRSVGEDLLIVTRYDGLRARTSNPALTAVDLGLEAISSAAVEKLVAVLDGEGPDQSMVEGEPAESVGRDRSLPAVGIGPRLVVRESTTGPQRR